MTREEAIELLKDLYPICGGDIEDNNGRDYDEAFRMAIEALTEPSGDLISRQAVRNVILENYRRLGLTDSAMTELSDKVKSLPSADTDMSDYCDRLWKAAYERGKAEGNRSTEDMDYCNNCPYISWDKDCISRQQAVEVVHKYFADEMDKTPHEIDEDGDEVYTDMKAVNELLKHNKHISKAIKELPVSYEIGYTHGQTAPTERTGEWIVTEHKSIEDEYEEWRTLECSFCGATGDVIPGNCRFNYCPNCGAKMKGGAK